MLLSREELGQMFPTKLSGSVFVLYMLMFVAQGLLVTTSRHGSSTYSYNTTTVVLLTETLKLLLSTLGYLANNSPATLLTTVKKHTRILLLYLVPSSLYCLYNNLSFFSLAYFNPTTYFMFMQIRLLLTGIVYQILFKKQLSRIQWFSLLLLTAGCMVHASGTGVRGLEGEQGRSVGDWLMGLSFLLVQVLCSVFAGVYNEFIIKGEGADVDIMIQNIFMYVDSIFFNVILLGAKGELASAFTAPSLASVGQALVLVLILNNAVLGIVTSLFLKSLNSIVKSFASALELVLTALISVPILGIPLSLETVLAILTISAAVLLYAKNPVKQETVQSTLPNKA